MRGAESKTGLSMSPKQRLAALVKERQERAWLDENKAAIENYKAFVQRTGVFAEDERLF